MYDVDDWTYWMKQEIAQQQQTYSPMFDNFNIIKRLEERGECSPDFDELKFYKYVPVFLYHRFLTKTGINNKDLLPDESKYLGQAYSCAGLYQLKANHDRSLTVAFNAAPQIVQAPAAHSLIANHLLGEVYALTPRAILNVDKILDNGKIFQRFPRSFTLFEQQMPLKDKIQHPALKCFVYLGVEKYWEHQNMYKQAVAKDYSIDKWHWVN